jgi:hypothetical protein
VRARDPRDRVFGRLDIPRFACNLDEQNRLGVRGKAGVKVFFDGAHDRAIHDLERRRK